MVSHLRGQLSSVTTVRTLDFTAQNQIAKLFDTFYPSCVTLNNTQYVLQSDIHLLD